MRTRASVDEEVERLLEDRLRDALHEMRQPLATMFALAEAARGSGAPVRVRGYLDQLIEQIREVVGSAWSVLEPHTLDDATPLDLDELLDSVFAAFRVTWRGTLVRRGDRVGVCTHGARATVRRCLVNVIDNATRAAGADGTVVVTVRHDIESIRILVEDDGPGFGRIAPGDGVGLRLSQDTLRAMGGELELGPPSASGGAQVVIAIPAVPTTVEFTEAAGNG